MDRLANAVDRLDRLRYPSDISFDRGGRALAAAVRPASREAGQSYQSRIWRFTFDGNVTVTIHLEGAAAPNLETGAAYDVDAEADLAVPVEALAHKFEFTRFEPSGWTKNPELRHVHSLVDYIFRWLAIQCSETYRNESAQRKHEPDDESDSELS